MSDYSGKVSHRSSKGQGHEVTRPSFDMTPASRIVPDKGSWMMMSSVLIRIWEVLIRNHEGKA